MADPFVDADVIIRLVTGDDPGKQQKARALFQAVENGQLVITALDIVIFEVVYVLASKRLYKLSRSDIQHVLTPILHPSGFKLGNKRVVLRALDLYASTNLPFGDAFIAAAMEENGSSIIFSFDSEHFDRIPGITRHDPLTFF